MPDDVAAASTADTLVLHVDNLGTNGAEAQPMGESIV